VKGRVLLVGILVLALSGAVAIGEEVGGTVNSAPVDCTSCPNQNPTPVHLNVVTVPTDVLYILLAVGALVTIVGLVMKGPKKDAV
jgi:hypothetical protein